MKKLTHNYGVEILRTVEEEYILDRENGNSLWRDALYNKISNLIVSFDILEYDQPMTPRWGRTSRNIVFDVRMTM